MSPIYLPYPGPANDYHPRHSVLIVLLLLLAGIAVSGCEVESRRQEININDVVTTAELLLAPPSEGEKPYFFGFDLRSDLKEDARQYLPFLQYLEKETGLRFELHFTPQNSTIVDELGRGAVQFAAVGAVSYLLAHERYGTVPLVRGINSAGRAEYQSCLVSAPQSNITRIEDMRGKVMAFGDRSSTQGYLIPLIILAENGLALSDLADHLFTGSHKNCAEAVITGQADICGMQDLLAKSLAQQGLLKIIHTSADYPSSGIAASRELPPAVTEKVEEALLRFQPLGKDAAGLHNWELTEMANGFTAARDEDYETLRRWARQFGQLADLNQ